MIIGGFTTRPRVDLFSATLPVGAPLRSDEWTLTTGAGSPQRAMPLVAPAPRNQWDRRGTLDP